MSEFVESTHQSAEVTPEVNEAPIQQEETQTEDPAAIQESNFFEVKYNKEPVRVSYDEAPDYIQKGMNYDKVQSKVSEYEQHLNRVAQVAGYETHDELLQALDQAEKEREQQKYVDAGIDPDTFNSLLEQHPDIQYAREMKQKEEASQKFNAEANEFFSEFPDVKPEDIPAEVWTLKDQKGLTLLDSYLRVNYKSLGQQKEQEAIQKLQTNSLSSPGSLSGGDVPHKANIGSMGKSDFSSLVEKVLRGEVKNL
ncbi:hypothetical protein AB1K32_15100 [Metabacillus dongyingensis]|uniref:hypothetical protein n=1 Tax=Metabacillus dongyingensis TaxID=2874282 RepID=UPI003B8B0D7B